MGIVISDESEYGKELKKWDTPKRQGGMNANGYEEYPRMLFQARDEGNGKAEVHRMPPPRWAFPAGVTGDAEWNQACLQAEDFTKRCQVIVRSDMEKANYLSRGWALTQDDALAVYEQQQETLAIAAAERLYSDQRLSTKARREADAVDRATDKHLGDLPVPRKKRGRKPKAPMVVVP